MAVHKPVADFTVGTSIFYIQLVTVPAGKSCGWKLSVFGYICAYVDTSHNIS